MNKIIAISIWWYAFHPADTEVNFHRQDGIFGSYSCVTASSRQRLGDVLRWKPSSVSMASEYTYIYYNLENQS